MYINREFALVCILEKGVPEEIEREIGAGNEEEGDARSPVEGNVRPTGCNDVGEVSGLGVESEEGKEAKESGERDEEF